VDHDDASDVVRLLASGTLYERLIAVTRLSERLSVAHREYGTLVAARDALLGVAPRSIKASPETDTGLLHNSVLDLYSDNPILRSGVSLESLATDDPHAVGDLVDAKANIAERLSQARFIDRIRELRSGHLFN
jgi:hypothetical protein